MISRRRFLTAITASTFLSRAAFGAAQPLMDGKYGRLAREVMAHAQQTFVDAKTGLYIRGTDDRKPDYIWRQAAAFSALVGAARHEPKTYVPLLSRHFKAMDVYWDTKARVPGYEPAPTKGNGHDKYYDDNAWLVITFAEAFALTGDRAYLNRAEQTARFVTSGADDKLGGGIWWHERHLDDSKNACVNGPAAVGYLYLARLGPRDQAKRWLDDATKLVEWTQRHLQDKDGLYDDRVTVKTGQVQRGKLTYNSALMLRANLNLYRQTGEERYLKEARRIGDAAGAFKDDATGLYRDPMKWSQFMVEADIDLYRATQDAKYLDRACSQADGYYANWSKRKWTEMMATVGLARILWLLADLETDKGKAFWERFESKP